MGEEYMCRFPHDGGCSRNLGIVAWVPVTIETAYSDSAALWLVRKAYFAEAFWRDKEDTEKGSSQLKWHSKEKSLIIWILEIPDNRDCNYYYKAQHKPFPKAVSVRKNFKYEEELI